MSATHQPPATATTGGRLTVKDLITVGVFSAFYIVAFYVAGMLGIIPIFMVLLALMCPIVGGIPFMLYLTRVKKLGMVTTPACLSGSSCWAAAWGGRPCSSDRSQASSPT